MTFALAKTALTASVGLAVTCVWAVTPATASSAGEQPGRGAGAYEVVVDSSAAMAEKADKTQSRMGAVQAALREAFGEAPADAAAGVRVYGAAVTEGLKSCKDSSLLAPVDTVDKVALLKAVTAMQPLGKAPIGYALEEAADDLPGDKPATIILVANAPGNCGSDPCLVAGEISDAGEDLHIDVVGFQARKEARAQLNCIASASGGMYVDVSDASELPLVLSRLTKRAAHGYPPAGRGIEGGPAAANAVAVSDGQWIDTIGDSDTEYYRLLDPEGGTLHVAATVRPIGPKFSDDVELALGVTSVDGANCGDGATATAQAASGAPLTVTYTLDGDELSTCGPGPYTLSVASIDEEVRPLGLLVSSEPSVESTDGLPDAATRTGSADALVVSPDPRFDAVGSSSFSAAPTLEPGTYSDRIRPGETRFYRADLDWGQQLLCGARTAGDEEAATGDFVIRAYGPQRQRVGLFDQSGGTGPVASPPVRYLNRESSAAGIRAAARAGGYYCSISVPAKSTDVGADGAIGVFVAVDVAGEAGVGEPGYTDKPESAEKAVEVVDEGGIPALMLIGVPILLVGIGAALWYHIRRRKLRL